MVGSGNHGGAEPLAFSRGGRHRWLSRVFTLLDDSRSCEKSKGVVPLPGSWSCQVPPERDRAQAFAIVLMPAKSFSSPVHARLLLRDSTMLLAFPSTSHQSPSWPYFRVSPV